MHDLEDRIRHWTDGATAGASPVTTLEALTRVEAGARGRSLGRGRSRRRLLAVSGVAAVAAVAVLLVVLWFVPRTDVTELATRGDEPVPAPERGPYDEGAEMRPDLLRVQPDEAFPGDVVALHFPQGTERGEAFVLERAVGDAWSLRYALTASSNSEWGGHWAPADSPEEYVWDDIGVAGTGPQWVTVPDTAEPGEYRVCTANAGENFCTAFRVLDPDGGEAPTNSPDGYRDFDRVLREVAAVVPQFGGFFLASGGQSVNIWLTGPATVEMDAERAQQVLRELVRRFPDQLHEGLSIEVLRATYTWRELHRWHNVLLLHLDEPGIVFFDIDERENRLLVAVADLDRDGPAVRSRAADLGVPEGALELVESGEFVDAIGQE